MVDCDFFTDFNKELTVYSNRLLLEFKKCDYNLELYLYVLWLGPSPTPPAPRSPRNPKIKTSGR